MVEAGSFSRAADRRNVAQPAFSRRIRLLEEWIGVTLFDRDRQPIRLTDAGRQLMPIADNVVHQIYQGRRHEPAFAELAFDELLGVSGVITVRLNRFTHSGLLILGFPAHLKDGLTPV